MDYKSAIGSWLALEDERISGVLLVDNSGFDLTDLQKYAEARNKFRRPLEFLSFDDEPAPEGTHYGFGELGIIDHGLRESALLADSTSFVKVTGRLYFPSLPRLLDRLGADVLAAADGRNPVRGHRHLATQLMLFDRAFYLKELAFRRNWIQREPGRTHAEDFFYQHLLPFERDPRVILRFPLNLEPVGVGATTGTDYRAPLQRAKSIVRAVSRRVAPRFWI